MDSVQDSHLVERALRMAHTLRGGVSDELVFMLTGAHSLRADSYGMSVKNSVLHNLWAALGYVLITQCQNHSGRR